MWSLTIYVVRGSGAFWHTRAKYYYYDVGTAVRVCVCLFVCLSHCTGPIKITRKSIRLSAPPIHCSQLFGLARHIFSFARIDRVIMSWMFWTTAPPIQRAMWMVFFVHFSFRSVHSVRWFVPFADTHSHGGTYTNARSRNSIEWLVIPQCQCTNTCAPNFRKETLITFRWFYFNAFHHASHFSAIFSGFLALFCIWNWRWR